MSAFKFAGSLYLDRVPAPLRDWLGEHLGDAALWGAIETGSSRAEGDVWLITSTDRNALAAVGKKGRYWHDLPLLGQTTTSTKMSRIKFLLDGKELFDASRIGSGDLESLFPLAFRPRSEALLDAALAHAAAHKWLETTELLALAVATLTPKQRESKVAYLSLSEQIQLHRAHAAMKQGDPVCALGFLMDVSEARQGDDLLRATVAMQDTDGWLLTLALAHEEAGQATAAAKVYEKLIEVSPSQDLFVLSRARSLRRGEEFDAACETYETFINGRVNDDLTLDRAHEGEPELVAACLESGELLEELGRHCDAATRYVTLIREAPLARQGYERLFAMPRDLLVDHASVVNTAAEVLRLLNPGAASEIERLPDRHPPVELPAEYAAFSDEAHDMAVLHPTERHSTSVAQKWVGALTSDDRDTADIERHAQRVDEQSHPEIDAMLTSVATLVGVPPPRFFLSYGSSGVEVLGVDSPFLLLGACHLEPGHERQLDLRQLAFALGGQLEHIRAKHLLLTSSEFWRTFGTKSATALLAFVPMGELVGKLADGSVRRWVGKLKQTTDTPMVKSLIDMAEKRVTGAAAADGMQSAYTAALAKARSTGLAAPEDDDSLMKERLADFARSAQYTADRAGLLACDDLAAAVESMLLLSPSLHERANSVAAQGVLEALPDRENDGAAHEMILRIEELLKFALSDEYQRLRTDLIET